jgi:PIN domain nuclease of toxin-antitoxin system
MVRGGGSPSPPRRPLVRLLLDTHFLIWILTGADRLRDHAWIDDHRPWVISPISLLELQYLAESGRLQLRAAELGEALQRDARFVVDEPPLGPLVRHALPLSWTRDPFDRLLAAHSTTRRVPLCTVDRILLEHHPLTADRAPG